MNLLFVCSGNTCRSAMAEALARKIAERRGIKDLNVSSAGTNAWDNVPATDEALLVGMERDIDLTGHRARKLTPAIVSEADLIFVMTPGHLEQVKQLGGRGKVHVILRRRSRSVSPDRGRTRERIGEAVRPPCQLKFP